MSLIRKRSSQSESLPLRWKRNRQRAALYSVAALVIFNGLLHEQSGSEQLGAWWLRARFSLREGIANALHVPSRDPRIVLVEIDDRCLNEWKEPTIAWGGHLTKAVEQLNRSGVRVIAMDWFQGAESQTFLKPKYDFDQTLGDAFAASKAVVMVKAIRPEGSVDNKAKDGYLRPAASLLYSLPGAVDNGFESCLGFADLPGENNIKSSYFPTIPGDDEDSPTEVSFAQRIIEKSGLTQSKGPPTRPDGSLLINFPNNIGATGEASPFERISILELEKATQPDPRFKDKIVIVGSNFKGDNDSHSIPLMSGLLGTREVRGMQVQASAVRTLLDGDAIEEPQGMMVWLLAVAFGIFGVGALTALSWGRVARLLIMAVVLWSAFGFCLFCAADYSLPLVLPFLSLLLGSLMMGGYRALSEERERSQVMKIWGRHQDPRLIEELLAHPERRGGQGEEVEVTVLFADLKNFTKTVERFEPQQALDALNRYLALLSNIILEHGGIVDKYLGDGLMAQWGTPTQRPDHATAAVQACLAIERRVKGLTEKLNKEDEVSFEVRLTLHSGKVVAGPLGSDKRLEYTIIGDTVNVTSRLQETAKALGCDFLISETTCAALDGAVRTGRETEVEIRGRKAPLRVFEVLDDEIHAPNFVAGAGCEKPNGQNVSKV